ncbi:MAG: hypothetical protein KatS3mg068_1660 [Candidatus Sericytochromatia bacterium]|nr:MAG: hypothetical protein KatS3mg068_1660 [Candidatus Sericytochromatia bacterium]
MNIDENIIIALERISEAFNVMMWEYNKKQGLSFIQLKILNFLMFNSNESNRNVSFISREFNISKASVSDSIKNLEKKEIVFRIKNNTSKKEILNLTEKGKNIASNIMGFTNQLKDLILKIEYDKKKYFLNYLCIFYTVF